MMYQFIIEQKVQGNLFIEADTKEEAQALATELLNQDTTTIQPDYSWDDDNYQIVDVIEVPRPNNSDIENAKTNKERLDELTEVESEAATTEPLSQLQSISLSIEELAEILQSAFSYQAWCLDEPADCFRLTEHFADKIKKQLPTFNRTLCG
jgi:hypothetical protein